VSKAVLHGLLQGVERPLQPPRWGSHIVGHAGILGIERQRARPLPEDGAGRGGDALSVGGVEHGGMVPPA
jgi:hypothetical protein